jgi:hypothetical protein
MSRVEQTHAIQGDLEAQRRGRDMRWDQNVIGNRTGENNIRECQGEKT